MAVIHNNVNATLLENIKPMDPEIREIKKADFSKVMTLPPPEWNFDMGRYLQLHYKRSNCHMIVASHGKEVVAVGSTIFNRGVCWLGNIIVHPEYRRHGIGRSVTKRLIDIAEKLKSRSIVLIATSTGEKLYATLGFQKSHSYRFYKGSVLSHADDPCIRAIAPSDINPILAIDRCVTGEVRRLLLRNFMKGVVFEDKRRVCGFFLPHFGDGLILALNPEAGNRLLYRKLSFMQKTVVPEGNHSVHAFLKDHLFQEYMSAPRMFLKSDTAFHPQNIFSRATGYCG